MFLQILNTFEALELVGRKDGISLEVFLTVALHCILFTWVQGVRYHLN